MFFLARFIGSSYLCSAIKDGSVAQLDRATPF